MKNDKFQRLVLENQKAIMFALGYSIGKGVINDSLMYQLKEIEKVLAPKSKDLGYEGDIEESAVSSESKKGCGKKLIGQDGETMDFFCGMKDYYKNPMLCPECSSKADSTQLNKTGGKNEN